MALPSPPTIFLSGAVAIPSTAARRNPPPPPPPPLCSLNRTFLYTKNSRSRSPNSAAFPSIPFFPKSSRIPCRILCTSDNNSGLGLFEDFSVLPTDVPWNNGDTWSTLAAYFFCLHIPLSFGGLSVISQILKQPVLDPLTEAISVLLLQTMEFMGVLLLLHYTGKPRPRLSSIFKAQNTSKGRSWIKASTAGLGVLVLFVLLTSVLADQLVGPKDVNDPTLREIVLNSLASKAVCIFIYCFITPLLEETVYRGFLLTSLASTMKWHQAVIVSACFFSIAHFSYDNAMQLFLIGSVLGSVYCWSGTLVSSFVVHSVYNAAILIITSSS